MSSILSQGTVHRIPVDMQKALLSSKAIVAIWESLTLLARKEWSCWVTYVKQEVTRKEHVQRMLEDLKKGKRRPCCWIGCVHRADKKISPSVQGILKKRIKK